MGNNPVKRGGNANLKPLDPDTHRTNRWNFSGKNLSNIELKRLASRGVTDNDWMPDNRLKHPRLRRRGGNKTLMSASVDMEELEQKQEERWQEYLAVPEPKIDYFDWAALRERRQAFDMLEKVLLNAGRTSRLRFPPGSRGGAQRSGCNWAGQCLPSVAPGGPGKRHRVPGATSP